MATVVVAPQPVFPLPALQSADVNTVPAWEPAVLTVHPAEVWSVIVSVPARFTPSTISISPEAGQLGPNNHKAGQIPQMLAGLAKTLVYTSKIGQSCLHVGNIRNEKSMGECSVASQSD